MGSIPPTGESSVTRRRCIVTNRVDKIGITQAVPKGAVVKSAIIALVIVMVLGLCPWIGTAYAVGVYQDAADHAAFLIVPHKRAISSNITRTNDNDEDASVFTIAASYPLRSYLLVSLEQTYITLSRSTDIRNGFGDLRLRARARLFNRGGRAVRLAGIFRTGSGTRRLFPYSSQSVDLGLGLSYVDTLETVHVWGELGGALVYRAPENLIDADVHEDFGHVSAGTILPVTAKLNLSVGFTALVFRSGGARELYYSSVEYGHSDATRFIFAVHAEAGKEEERISDLSLSAGIRIFY